MKYRHVVVSKFGGMENLSFIQDDLQEPKENEVRVKVLTAGVSLADVLMREGAHPESMNRKTPFTLGWDIVGVIDKLGDRVSNWKTGQIVAALPIVGGYSEFVILPSEELIPIPQGVDPSEAVSMVLNYTTAYQMLHRCAKIGSDQSILIHGASGGIGTALLQLGKLENLKMFGTASRDKHNIVSSLGGSPIDYKSMDLFQDIVELTRNRGESGVDAVFDGLGGKSLKLSYKILSGGGKLVAYGPFYPSEMNEWLTMFTLNLVPDNREFFLYSIQTLKRLKPDWFREDLVLLLNLLKEGKVKPIIDSEIPLSQAAKAHELLVNHSVKGKIVLICNN